MHAKKKALITGITGQDGTYLAQWLLEHGYQVYGTHRFSDPASFWRLNELNLLSHPNLQCIQTDLQHYSTISDLINTLLPDEIYHLAAQSSVAQSFQTPHAIFTSASLTTAHFLEILRLKHPTIRFFQASSAEMFGKTTILPQDERTPCSPCSPYGIAKLYAHHITEQYRHTYQLFACSGILFSHESPLRGLEFVTRKITHGIANILLGHLDCLELGNLETQRDWGFAPEYVRAMWLSLQADTPDSYVFASQRTCSIRDFVKMTFDAAGISVTFHGEGLDSHAVEATTGRTVMRVNPLFYRPLEAAVLMGNAGKAKSKLGWEAKTSLETLCQMMLTRDLERQNACLMIN